MMFRELFSRTRYEKSLTLTSAKCGFDAFVTVDRGLPYQQDLSLFDLAVVVLEANSNAIVDLAPSSRKSGSR